MQNLIEQKALEIKSKWHHTDSELKAFMYKMYTLQSNVSQPVI